MTTADDPFGDCAWLAAKKAALARPGSAKPVVRIVQLPPSDDMAAYHGVQAIDGRVWNGRRYEP